MADSERILKLSFLEYKCNSDFCFMIMTTGVNEDNGWRKRILTLSFLKYKCTSDFCLSEAWMNKLPTYWIWKCEWISRLPFRLQLNQLMFSAQIKLVTSLKILMRKGCHTLHTDQKLSLIYEFLLQESKILCVRYARNCNQFENCLLYIFLYSGKKFQKFQPNKNCLLLMYSCILVLYCDPQKLAASWRSSETVVDPQKLAVNWRSSETVIDPQKLAVSWRSSETGCKK